MDTVTPITVAEYEWLLEDFDALQTIFLGGTWPIARGRHADLGEVILGHIGDQAVMIRSPRSPLRCAADPIPL
ncbi:MAG: hypothetical protein JWP57_4036 [Spirosoma sp.]|nr:hypothetical protein [Spirosoma sp.]